ncbi:FecCD family ABC transporter permease [Paenibacillus radicis (ex Gao et al. 2016)]|uniref:Siderophore ABC transporter permease n=1 Tax=Paenibacillus radicis (ex Gao et al. 2016) TaxID=1737354 RepID=A0A917H623_9BACL|nr:iron ABC transporter permease [Paenibacillus radicis (ex Gao et al. 2016)]GGG68302.1 siderophore ABC transporter permease [Paenibacillus radicis (ex Gao et al. 2016)]
MTYRWTGFIFLFVLVGFALIASIAFGVVQISVSSIINAIWSFDGAYDQLIIRSVRLPRALIAAAVGGSLAVAGCLMQALSRNGLAGPEIFGVNNGAALAVVIVSIVLHSTSLAVFTWAAMAGAAIAGATVFLLGSIGRQSLTSIKLILAGATINLLFASLTQGILILNEQSLDTMRFWLAGSLTGRDLQLFLQVVPYMIAGLAAAFVLSHHMNVIGLGEEMAQGLGQRIVLIKVLCIVVSVLLAGSAVAIAGPIAFIGLAIPHIARALVGSDYRWVIPYSALLGALLLLIADIGARFVLPAQEVPAGIVTAFFGAPFLIYLAQRRGRTK